MRATLLVVLMLMFGNLYSQDIPYGLNDHNGKYVNTDDAKIYYEVYLPIGQEGGEGKTVVLLHGGFGYIDSFKRYIPILSKKYKVIAIASRGYGRSEIGSKNYSYSLLAEDVKAIIEKEIKGQAIIIGSSDGAMIAYIVASKYPEIVSKVVSMGGPLGTSGYDQEGLDWLQNFSSQEFELYRPNLKQIMPQPERWEEFSAKLKSMWSITSILQPEDLAKIECPVLLLFGDRDLFCTKEHIAHIYKGLPRAQLNIFPNSTHSDISFRNTEILEQYILKFLD